MFRPCSHVLLSQCMVDASQTFESAFYCKIQITDYMKIIVTYLVNTRTFLTLCE